MPAEPEAVHRIIDFAKGDFFLRWQVPEGERPEVTLRLRQQLAQRGVERPIIAWSMQLDESEEWVRHGRLMVESALRPHSLARLLAETCAAMLAEASSHPPAAEGADASS